MALKESWKDAGVGFGHAFRDLGKAFAKTAKTTIHKMDEWANKDEEYPEAEKKPEPVIVGQAEDVQAGEEKAQQPE
jgi:hypothetical protein